MTSSVLVENEKSTFKLRYTAQVNIRAGARIIFGLLTNAADFPRWNSTVESIKGTIADGQRLELRAKVAPDRVFKLNVSAVVPDRSMVWSDGFAPMFKG